MSGTVPAMHICKACGKPADHVCIPEGTGWKAVTPEEARQVQRDRISE